MKRIKWIDIAKGIGILLVVVGHSSAISIGGGYVGRWINSFHMPLFFVMSGLCFDARKPIDRWGYCVRKLQGLLWPYFGLSLVCALLSLVFYFGNDPSMGFISQIGSALMLHSRISPFWFLIVLLACELAYRGIYFSIKSRCAVLFVCCGFAAIGTCPSVPATLPYCPILPKAFLGSLLFYCIGHFLRDLIIEKKFLRVRIALVAIVALVIHSIAVLAFLKKKVDYSSGNLGVAWIYCLIALLGTVGASASAMLMDGCKWLGDILAYVGRNSIVLLAIHGHLGIFRVSWSKIINCPTWLLFITEYAILVLVFWALSSRSCKIDLARHNVTHQCQLRAIC